MDFLKIDGVFVKDVVDDPINLAMVKSINDIGKVMGKRTIAEFVRERWHPAQAPGGRRGLRPGLPDRPGRPRSSALLGYEGRGHRREARARQHGRVGRRCTHSCCCATARASGTGRTGFTGWTDVDLTEQGAEEAPPGGPLDGRGGVGLRRRPIPRCSSAPSEPCGSRWTSWIRCGCLCIVPGGSTSANYGALQGLNKAETAKQYGDDQVLVWRRSYDTPPPALEDGDPRLPTDDSPLPPGSTAGEIPRSECLKDTVERFLPYWHETVAPRVRAGERVIIAAHGNSLRALVKYLDGVSDEDIVGLNIPTGVPLVYELDDSLAPTGSRYLGDAAEVVKAMQSVANQGKAK